MKEYKYLEKPIPKHIVEQIRADAIDEAIIEIQKLNYGVMDKDELFYKICDLLVKLKGAEECGTH